MMVKLSDKLIELNGLVEAPYIGKRVRPYVDTKEAPYVGERVKHYVDTKETP